MATIARVQDVLAENPNLRVLSKDAKWVGFSGDAVLNLVKNLSDHVEKRLIAPDDHLLPTTAAEVVEHFTLGNAIVVADNLSFNSLALGTKVRKAVAYTAYMDRFGQDIKNKLRVEGGVPSMAELYCVVVDEKHREKGLGTAIVHELMRDHILTNKDITTFVTFQEKVVALFKRASDLLREDGMSITFRAFSGGELPMLYQFLTLANPHKYSSEEIARIDGTNPLWRIERGILTDVNQYLLGNGSSFDLKGTNMFFISDVEKAYQADAALSKRFGNSNVLKEVLIGLEYTI